MYVLRFRPTGLPEGDDGFEPLADISALTTRPPNPKATTSTLATKPHNLLVTKNWKKEFLYPWTWMLVIWISLICSYITLKKKKIEKGFVWGLLFLIRIFVTVPALASSGSAALFLNWDFCFLFKFLFFILAGHEWSPSGNICRVGEEWIHRGPERIG